MAHPLKTRLIADAQIKTARLDAFALGALLRADLVAQAHIPRRETRPGASTYTITPKTINNVTVAIAGTFANLPDGAILTVGANTFTASYEGGDGNDLTLMVVPGT